MSTITPRATGRRDDRAGTPYLVFERTFRAPIADVWAAVTEPERLERWIGTWSGDPASGAIAFRMTAEGEDVPEEEIVIDECVEPTRLVLRSATPDDPQRLWRWELALAEADGVTTLTFAQEVTNVAIAESVGPGWDYYLDRLVTACGGADPGQITFEPYLERSDHYRGLFV